MYKKFKSLAGTEFAYCYDSQQYGGNAPIDANFRQFYVYNDGLTAHSADWPIQKENIADYLGSLAEAMLTDAELANELSFKFGRKPSVKQIEFAAGIIYKSPKENESFLKRTYFSVSELKVSTSPSKQHDKRYEEVRSIHDGSPAAIFRILIPEYASGLERYLYADAIREWAIEQDGMWMEQPWEFLKWAEDRDKGYLISNSLRACLSLVEARRLTYTAEASLANYKRRIEVKEAPKAEAPAEQVQS
jgi:hypothetical protein